MSYTKNADVPESTKNQVLSLSNEIDVFYREAGNVNNPKILLLHGFPSSSRQYRNLMNKLSSRFHCIAPDLPGFGYTKVPSSYKHTFENMANTISSFIDAIKFHEFSVYIFDYGAPTFFRLVLQRPDLKITSVITQNGNAYIEGLGQEFWAPVKAFWAEDTPDTREGVGMALTLETTKFQYIHGVPDPKVLDPECWLLDYALMEREGQRDIQLGLFKDYKNNTELYPEFQKWLRESKVRVLAVWGENDVIFVKEGAEAFRRDVPDVVVKFVDSGHFALENCLEDIVQEIFAFL